jgi:vacuolar-type H+-ATPase subunit E/Vma4
MSIEKLTSTIIESAQQKAKEITDKYEQEIQKINNNANEEIAKLVQENDEYIARQKSLVQTRLISNAQLKAQQEILKIKWKIIDNVFTQAKQRFLASEDYLSFIKDIISTNNDSDSELFISKHDQEKFQKSFPGLKYTASDDLTGGLIIRKGRIELNFSIDKIFESLKNDLIIDLSKLLFE